MRRPPSRSGRPRQPAGPGLQRSNLGGRHSDADMMRRGGAAARMAGADGAPQRYQVEMEPERGDPVVFPAWLRRGARPYTGNQERVSVAMSVDAARMSRRDGSSQGPAAPAALSRAAGPCAGRA